MLVFAAAVGCEADVDAVVFLGSVNAENSDCVDPAGTCGAGGGDKGKCSLPGFVKQEPTPAPRGGGGSVSRLLGLGPWVAVWSSLFDDPVEE